MKNLSNINLGDANILNEDEMKSLKGGEEFDCGPGLIYYTTRCTNDVEFSICARSVHEALKKGGEFCRGYEN